MIGLCVRVVSPEIRIDRDTPLSPEWYAHTDDSIACHLGAEHAGPAHEAP
jgi:hypothetical protein